MSALEVLRIPARRDVKALGATLATVESGQRIRATFVSPRYGTFVVSGDAVASDSTKALTLAGRFIAQGVKPDRELRLLAAEPA
ncbi:MAG TPA: hypothetical protein VGP24_03455, partial [Glaciihabitans sp.]|nr:hypothetical protein [Glaciihabitans sp.]